jgi:hypothetical protein
MRVASSFLILCWAVTAHAQQCPAGTAWDALNSMCQALPETRPPASPEGLPNPEPVPVPADEHAHHHHHEHMHHEAMTNAQMFDMMTTPDGCGAREYYHFGMSMCLDRPQSRGHFSGMVMGNAFMVDSGGTGLRARHSLAGPNWLMANGGVDLAWWNRVEVDAMLTAELWTLPKRGYYEPLQIGEENSDGVPFIDAQHPHSSPLMGLAFTDVIQFSQVKMRLLRLWFAPRGEATDGPIAFMHRPSAAFNPDAPLGHHIGQDVGHVTSTVIGASLHLGVVTLEASTFAGREPHPTEIDLPILTPDSFAFRAIGQIGRHWTVAASFAYVDNPEGDPEDTKVYRASASGYLSYDLPKNWRVHASLIWGGVANYDHTPWLNSILAEATFSDGSNSPWIRLEVLQRTPAELAISASNSPQWVGAWTLGFTRRIVSLWAFDFNVGAAGTLSFLPNDYQPAYGGAVVAVGRLYLEARFVKMWSLGGREM